MRRSSYPSPVNNEGTPAAPFDLSPATPPQDQTDVQRSFHRASAALEAAYRRIRQVRRNLLEVTENMPPLQTSGRPSEYNNASFDQIPSRATESAVRDTAPFLDDEPYFTSDHDHLVTARAYSEARGTSRRPDLLPLTTLGMVNHIPSETSDPSHFSHRPYLFPRRPQFENRLYRRRDSHVDDPSTSLGRRVAAREAAGSSSSGAIHTTSALNSLSRSNGNSAQLLTSIERDIDNFRAMARQRRSEPASLISPESAAVITSNLVNRLVDNSSSTRRSSQPINGTTTVSSSPVGLHPDSRRVRLTREGGYSARPSVSTQSERLSLLSNFSLQNLPTPVSAGAPRPLIFDEPSSYIRAADFSDAWGDLVEEPEPRNYVVRRRYNNDGEEHVHPITLEWMDEAPSWIGPVTIREHERGVGGQNSQSTAPLSGPPRRRGWARLDPDGNEIPSDEEEELERIRAEYRIQAQARSRASISTAMDSAESNPGFHSLHAVTTSASPAPDEDTAAGITNIPRVRLNSQSQDQWASFRGGSAPDLSGGCGGAVDGTGSIFKGQQCFLPPFRPNPLPMPIEDMVWAPTKQRSSPFVVIPVHASFAGR